MLRLRLKAEGEEDSVWISCSPTDKVSDILTSKRWGAVTGKERLAVWVKFEGAKLHKDDVLSTFVCDKDELVVGFSDTTTKSVAPPDVDELEKALSVFFDENLFAGGRAKTVAELDEFQGLPSDDEEEDEEHDDDTKALCLAVAMYNFAPEEPDEIGFVVGDKMVVYRKREDGWWRGRHLGGPNKLAGYFPGNRVKVESEGAEFLKEVAPASPAAVAVTDAAAAVVEQGKGPAVVEAVVEEKRSTVTVTMEYEVVDVHTAPGHGSPEMLRAVLETEETKVSVCKTTMETEDVVVEKNQPVLPRRSVSMESRALAAGATLAEQGRWTEAAETLAAVGEGGSASLCFARGEARERSGEARLALRDYSVCLQQQPGHIGALMGRARLASLAGRHAVARHDALCVLRLQPRNTLAMLAVAQAEEGLSNPSAAAVQLECLLGIDPGCVEALTRLARLKLSSNDLAACRDLLTRVVALGNPSATVLEQLGFACSGLRLFREACQAFTTALEMQPRSASVWRAKAMSHAALSEWSSACDNLGTALLLLGSSAPFSLHAELAVSLTRLDRHAEALLQWTRAADLRASDPWLLGGLASSLRACGRLDEALARAQQSLQLDKTRPKVWLLAGQLFAAKDNKQSAREHFEKALALDPKLVFAREELAKLDK